MQKIKIFFVSFFLILLSACSNVEIYSGLSENQANVMLSTLLKRGIEAEKVSAGKAGFSIRVKSNQMVQALEILEEHSLPRDEFQNLGTVFSGQGMITTANEEKSRLAYAISQELSATFSQIDGVLSARVHIVLAEIDNVNNKETPASAAIFLRHTPDSSVVNFTAKIKEVTASSVASLLPENVAVMLVPSRDDVTVPVIQNNNASMLRLLILALIINAIGMIGFIAYKNRKDLLSNTKNNVDEK